MKVFVTGAAGWIGSAVVAELLDAGHSVTGLARSDTSAAAISAAGAVPVRGSLDDPDGLRAPAAAADAVVHLAFNHDFDNFAAAGKLEYAAVTALADTLSGSGRPMAIASGLAGTGSGRPLLESDRSPFVGPDAPRGGSENLLFDYTDRDVRTIATRFAPSVHGMHDHGFIARLFDVARERGVSGYVGDGATRWSAVHRRDAATLVRLAIESAPAGTVVHAIGEQELTARSIAERIGDALGVPVRSIEPDTAFEHFGWIGGFFGADVFGSNEETRKLLEWEPRGPGLFDDIRDGAYQPDRR